MSGPWVVAIAGPLGIDLQSTDGLEVCQPLMAANGDGTHVSHSFLPVGGATILVYAITIDHINNRISVAPSPGARAATPVSWLGPGPKWLFEPTYEFHGGFWKPATTFSVCDCGSEKGGGGHFDWCSTKASNV